MEGKWKRSGRAMRRDYECNRLEEQVWTRAFEEIWPLIRRNWHRQPAACNGKTKTQKVARRA